MRGCTVEVISDVNIEKVVKLWHRYIDISITKLSGTIFWSIEEIMTNSNLF